MPAGHRGAVDSHAGHSPGIRVPHRGSGGLLAGARDHLARRGRLRHQLRHPLHHHPDRAPGALGELGRPAGPALRRGALGRGFEHPELSPGKEGIHARAHRRGPVGVETGPRRCGRPRSPRGWWVHRGRGPPGGLGAGPGAGDAPVGHPGLREPFPGDRRGGRGLRQGCGPVLRPGAGNARGARTQRLPGAGTPGLRRLRAPHARRKPAARHLPAGPAARLRSAVQPGGPGLLRGNGGGRQFRLCQPADHDPPGEAGLRAVPGQLESWA